MHFLRYYLWIAPSVLLGLVLFVFLRRKLHLQLPSFAVYAVAELLQFIAAIICSLHHPFSYRMYGLILAIGGGLDGIFAVWVLYELTSKLVLPRSSFATLSRKLFAGSLAIFVLGSAAISGAFSDHSIYRALNLFEDVDFSSAFIKVGLLLVLLVFSRVLNVSWRNWLVGIALGFGVDASFELSSAAWRTVYGRPALISVDITQGIGFHICVLIWLVYLLLPERPSRSTGSKLQKEDLEAWSEELQKIVH